MGQADDRATVKWGFEPHESNGLAIGKATFPTITTRDATLLVAPFTVNSNLTVARQLWQLTSQALKGGA